MDLKPLMEKWGGVKRKKHIGVRERGRGREREGGVCGLRLAE